MIQNLHFVVQHSSILNTNLCNTHACESLNVQCVLIVMTHLTLFLNTTGDQFSC